MDFVLRSTLLVLMSMMLTEKTYAWGSLTGYETHQLIDRLAYEQLRYDPAYYNSIFPILNQILAYEGVRIMSEQTSDEDPKVVGPGPDSEGATLYSEHYYNPKTSEGLAPDSAQKYYSDLFRSMLFINNENSAKSAAWAAHFVADLSVPFHTNGVSIKRLKEISQQHGESGSLYLPLEITGQLDIYNYYRNTDRDPNFRTEVDRFFKSVDSNRNYVEWFDPWYWNGRGLAYNVDSSHIHWEGDNHTRIKDQAYSLEGYSPEWKNSTSQSFAEMLNSQARQAAVMIKNIAMRTEQKSAEWVTYSPQIARDHAVRDVYTLWRASYSGLKVAPLEVLPKFSEIDVLRPKFVVRNKYSNVIRENPTEVQVRLLASGGCRLLSPSVQYVGLLVDSVIKEWDIEVTDALHCSLKSEIIGHYEQTPDLQYGSVMINMKQLKF